MRVIYLMFFMVLSLTISAQETFDLRNQKNEEILNFKLYPNPASGDVVNIITKDNHTKEITIYDVFGEMVFIDKIFGNTLNISRLVPGVYVLQVTENKKTITRKLVIK